MGLVSIWVHLYLYVYMIILLALIYLHHGFGGIYCVLILQPWFTDGAYQDDGSEPRVALHPP